jgi:uncharacterized protein YceH (UPF0502 family)
MEPQSAPSAPLLTDIEARILGSLLEKAATTPDVYPLTLNNIVLACNQKTSREPTMNLSTGDVGHALRVLEPRGLVKSEYGARSERYYHRIDRVFDLTPAQAALLALLMLRGPQTLNELLTRSERLHRFSATDDVQHALERLAEREPAMVRRIPRGAGQREDRYAHLLCGEPVMPERSDTREDSRNNGSIDGNTAETLIARIDALEARIAALESGHHSNETSPR